MFYVFRLFEDREKYYFLGYLEEREHNLTEIITKKKETL